MAEERVERRLAAILIADVEKLIEDYYQCIQITPTHREALAGMLHHEFDQLMAAETDELARLTTRRDSLQHEQERRLQAHYADAIPLSLLKREQDRILTELDSINRRIDAHHAAGILAQINAKDHNRHRAAPFLLKHQHHIRCWGKGAGHPIRGEAAAPPLSFRIRR